jgi:hypothetical protein
MPQTERYRFSSALLPMGGGAFNHRQPFEAVCRKCDQKIYFDIDSDGTPGFNGDWGDGEGDYGCVEDTKGNGHRPMNVRYNRNLYPEPK